MERLIYRVGGIDAAAEMDWKRYAASLLVFNALGLLLLFGLQRLQAWLPLGPSGAGAVSPDLAFNTATSFVTNTNWQAYAGETTMKYLTQMLGLTVQNFLSAATGIAVVVALIRGFSRKTTGTLGNFWVDLVRTTLYILLPLSLILAVFLVSQGVVQTFSPAQQAAFLQPTVDASGTPVAVQTIAVGPAASQIAIKELGTNGGGFFNANSAHPFENPTPFSNFLEMLALVLIPAALCYTFGRMVGNTRQGWAILAAMTIVLVGLVVAAYAFEARGVPQVAAAGADLQANGGRCDRPAGGQHGRQGGALRRSPIRRCGRPPRRAPATAR